MSQGKVANLPSDDEKWQLRRAFPPWSTSLRYCAAFLCNDCQCWRCGPGVKVLARAHSKAACTKQVVGPLRRLRLSRRGARSTSVDGAWTSGLRNQPDGQVAYRAVARSD